MCKATAPIDLLREIREGFRHEAAEYRRIEQGAFSKMEQQVAGAKAFAAENAVRKIDATLRDWA